MGQPRLSAGEIVAGKYRVERTVGEGGMGVVLAAQHLNLRRSVALKLLQLGASEQTVGRFLREAQIVAQLRSDHVPQVIDIDRLATGEPYIVMELLEGRDLGAELAARGPLPVSEAVDYLVQACEAVSQAHALGVVHRDLKPANLFLTRGNDGAPCIKVLDFGIAKLRAELDGPGASAGLTRTGSFLGSPAYMSPEQWTSARSVDPRSDLWSLGAILFELLSARPPFLGESMGELCNAVMNTAAPSLRSLRAEVPVELEAVVQRCLAKDPAARCQSPLELVAALRPFAPQSAWPLIARLTGGGPSPAPAQPTATAPTLPGDAFADAAGSGPSWGTGSAPSPGSGSLVASPSWGTGSAPSPGAAPMLPVTPRRGGRTLWVVLGVLVLLFAAFFTVRAIRRRTLPPRRPLSRTEQPSPPGPNPPSPGQPLPPQAGALFGRPGEVAAAASRELGARLTTTMFAVFADHAMVTTLDPRKPGMLSSYDYREGRTTLLDSSKQPKQVLDDAIPFGGELDFRLAGELPERARRQLADPAAVIHYLTLARYSGKPCWGVFFTLPPLHEGESERHPSVWYDVHGGMVGQMP